MSRAQVDPDDPASVLAQRFKITRRLGARGLVSETGADVIDAGPLTAARFIEPAMMLLVRLAYAQGMGTYGISFRVDAFTPFIVARGRADWRRTEAT